MRKHQAGVTFIGWIALLIPVAIVGYAAIRLVPIYLNHMKVAKTVEQVAKENKGEETISPGSVRAAIARRLDIEGVSYPTLEDFRVVREADGWVIEAAYEHTAPMFGGIQLLVSFDKRVVIQ